MNASTQSVNFVAITPNAEELITYCARVSNPKNQTNFNTGPKLLAYCAKNAHWSIFEMANMVLEVKTSRAVAAQILRHKSFSFQEFSQRYAETDSYVESDARAQDLKNRQNSLDILSDSVKDWFRSAQREVADFCYEKYKLALDQGIAKEIARFLLPLNTQTTIYINGNIRSWIHYIQVRSDPSTQKEHRDIALQAKKIFVEQLPNVAAALGWV